MEQVQKRGRGRPRKNPIVVTPVAPAAPSKYKIGMKVWDRDGNRYTVSEFNENYIWVKEGGLPFFPGMLSEVKPYV